MCSFYSVLIDGAAMMDLGVSRGPFLVKGPNEELWKFGWRRSKCDDRFP